MGFYNAYFDESYTDEKEQASLLAIGGYLLKDNDAKRLDAKWRKVLNDAGIPYFHAVDFMPGKHDLYKHLSKHRRIKIQEELIGLIDRHILQGFVVFVNHRKFDPEDLADAYSWCADVCVGAMQTKLQSLQLDGDVAFFFENGHEMAGRALEYMTRIRQGEKPQVTFAEKAKTPILQAADLLVWHAAKYVKDRVSGVRPPRGDFRNLVKKRHAMAFVSVANKVIEISWMENVAPDDESQNDFLRSEFGACLSEKFL